MESSFAEDEKRFVLSEMIKRSRLDIDVLVQFIKSNRIEPDWLDMPLPPGRTMNQCLEAAEDMFQTPMNRPSLKRKSLGDIAEHAPKRLAIPSPLEPSTNAAASSPLTPASQLHHRVSMPLSAPAGGPSLSKTGSNNHHVNIQPRPSVPGQTGSKLPTGPPSSGQTHLLPVTRRRGRPPRTDKSRQLRPLLPQVLAPLAPRTPTTPTVRAPSMLVGEPPEQPTQDENPGDVQSNAGGSLAGSPTPQEIPKQNKRRGRPPLARPASNPTSPGAAT